MPFPSAETYATIATGGQQATGSGDILSQILDLYGQGDEGAIRAQQLAVANGISPETIREQIAQAQQIKTGMRNTGGLVGQVLQKGVAPVGHYFAEHPAALFAAPFAVSGALGAFGAGAGAGGAGVGTATGTASNAFGGAVGGIGAEGVGAGTAAVAGGAAKLGLPGWLSIGSNLLSGILGNRAAGNAADAMSEASQAGIDETRRQFDLTRADNAPYQAAGVGALGRLQDPNAFQASPGYDWRRSEGQRDIGNSFAARGSGQSGNALRALTDYNQNLASNEYGNWWNQQGSLAGIGQVANQQVGTAGSNSAANIGSLLNAQGNARASGILGRGISTSNSITDAINNYLYRRRGP